LLLSAFRFVCSNVRAAFADPHRSPDQDGGSQHAEHCFGAEGPVHPKEYHFGEAEVHDDVGACIGRWRLYCRCGSCDDLVSTPAFGRYTDIRKTSFARALVARAAVDVCPLQRIQKVTAQLLRRRFLFDAFGQFCI